MSNRLKVPDNRNPDEDCYVTLFFYKIGVIFVQGRGEWEEKDMMDMKSDVKTLNKSTASHSSCISPTYTKPTTQSSLADRLYKTTSFLIPRSNSTLKNNQSVNSNKLKTFSLHPVDDSDVPCCSDLTKCSDDAS